ncbi:MAG TPA: hypothetical protein VHA76_10125, partial [Solirubrobacterales bacterium]|nr:hypothetical protein [Solirubrobacterales bacterium]
AAAERERLRLVRDLAAGAAAGDRSAARALWRSLRAGTTPPARWDVVSLGSRVIEYDEPGAEVQTLGDAPPAAWRGAAMAAGGR